jgi:hypothetical protein
VWEKREIKIYGYNLKDELPFTKMREAIIESCLEKEIRSVVSYFKPNMRADSLKYRKCPLNNS